MNQRLNNATLQQLRAGVARPAYDHAKVGRGVVHLGPGAFHRAHQAPAFDALLARDPRWGITGVSLHSPDVRDALAPQDGLYTLALLDEQVSFQVVGAIKEVLVAPENPEAALARLAAPGTQIVTLTITEKGYCLDQKTGELDLNHPDIRADLDNPSKPKSAIGFLAEALMRRRAARLSPLTIISCDNLTDNGVKLGRAVLNFISERDTQASIELAETIEFPRTMVDSITPATDDALRARVAEAIGVADAWPIQREAFTQWVMERHARKDGPANGPDWQAAGVTLADSVTPFERAKLRILNASHSSLAYLGILKGRETVADAMADPELAGFVRDLMEKDVTPGLSMPPDFDLERYREDVLKRFRNPAMRHLLAQIAWDGSQKLPNRLFGLVEEGLAAGRSVARPARTVAAWLLFLRRRTRDGETLVDPLAPLLLETAARANGDPAQDVSLFLALDTVFPSALAGNEAFRAALIAAYSELLR